MARPSPATVAWIRARSPDWTRTDAQIAGDLNGPTVPNPVAVAPTVPTPFSVMQVFGAVAPSSLGNLKSVAFVPDVRDKLAANDRPGCKLYADLLLLGGTITQADHDAILAIVEATGPDPSWTATIPASLVTPGRLIDAEDVAASRPGAD